MAYQYVATSVAGFIQQLAVGYITKGYYFYVAGVIPAHKNPALTDRKILSAYGIEVSKWTRARRKKEGFANVHYLRFENFYVIIANHGLHPFFADEARRLRDIRKSPIAFKSYSIGCRRARGGGAWHASVRIHRERERELNSYYQKYASLRSVVELYGELRSLPFEPYAPVRNQLRSLLRKINRRRSVAGLEAVPESAIRQFRSPVRPFAVDATKSIEIVDIQTDSAEFINLSEEVFEE